MDPLQRFTTINHLLPVWFMMRLQNLIQDAAHYEASYYGPFTAIFCIFFTPIWGFLVKPQPKLRETAETDLVPGVDDDDEFTAANLSLDSNGAPCYSHLNGKTAPKIPDFIIAMASSSLTDDEPIILVEVKREGESLKTAQEQLLEYIKLFQPKLSDAVDDFLAIVIAGSLSLFCVVPNRHVDPYTLSMRTIDTGSAEFCNLFDSRSGKYQRLPHQIP